LGVDEYLRCITLGMTLRNPDRAGSVRPKRTRHARCARHPGYRLPKSSRYFFMVASCPITKRDTKRKMGLRTSPSSVIRSVARPLGAVETSYVHVPPNGSEGSSMRVTSLLDGTSCS